MPTLAAAMAINVKQYWDKVPAVFKNPYFIVIVLFGAWMLFFDNNDLATQYRRHKELSALNEKKEYYLQQIAVTDEAYRELTSNPATQEKFAREHYHMKRDNEDVFVIVEKEKTAE